MSTPNKLLQLGNCTGEQQTLHYAIQPINGDPPTSFGSFPLPIQEVDHGFPKGAEFPGDDTSGTDLTQKALYLCPNSSGECTNTQWIKIWKEGDIYKKQVGVDGIVQNINSRTVPDDNPNKVKPGESGHDFFRINIGQCGEDCDSPSDTGGFIIGCLDMDPLPKFKFVSAIMDSSTGDDCNQQSIEVKEGNDIPLTPGKMVQAETRSIPLDTEFDVHAPNAVPPQYTLIDSSTGVKTTFHYFMTKVNNEPDGSPAAEYQLMGYQNGKIEDATKVGDSFRYGQLYFDYLRAHFKCENGKLTPNGVSLNTFVPSEKLTLIDGNPEPETLPSGITKEGEKYMVTGTLTDADEVPLEGYDVKMYERDFLKKDYLGMTTTDKKGRFQIPFEEEDFNTFKLEKHPDLAFRVKKDGKLVMATTKEVFKDAKPSDDPIVLRLPKD